MNGDISETAQDRLEENMNPIRTFHLDYTRSQSFWVSGVNMSSYHYGEIKQKYKNIHLWIRYHIDIISLSTEQSWKSMIAATKFSLIKVSTE